MADPLGSEPEATQIGKAEDLQARSGGDGPKDSPAAELVLFELVAGENGEAAARDEAAALVRDWPAEFPPLVAYLDHPLGEMVVAQAASSTITPGAASTFSRLPRIGTLAVVFWAGSELLDAVIPTPLFRDTPREAEKALWSLAAAMDQEPTMAFSCPIIADAVGPAWVDTRFAQFFGKQPYKFCLTERTLSALFETGLLQSQADDTIAVFFPDGGPMKRIEDPDQCPMNHGTKITSLCATLLAMAASGDGDQREKAAYPGRATAPLVRCWCRPIGTSVCPKVHAEGVDFPTCFQNAVAKGNQIVGCEGHYRDPGKPEGSVSRCAQVPFGG